ncbi:MAG TPA: thioredoxin family protein [Xanthobacteraceae bacterium]|jgi:predicted dithiol-disulfide oxidoreductase (DUF899 family)|nr:thioredoxin family protein [Xanthobacteraceae bacterium]
MQHPVVSQEEWLKARKEHLLREKEYTRQRDQLTAERRALPWVKVEKNYLFDTPAGRKSLADLFDGRSQLIVQHFMFAPSWEEGCVGCSFGADHADSARQHFEHHDVKYVAVARAPLAKLDAYKKRMGWQFDLVSSEGSDFNFDYRVSFTPEEIARGRAEYNYTTIDNTMEELPGFSVFYKNDKGEIFHTYSSYARGNEEIIGAYMWLDMTPLGRNETASGSLMDWVKRHDEYGAGAQPKSCCS